MTTKVFNAWASRIGLDLVKFRADLAHGTNPGKALRKALLALQSPYISSDQQVDFFVQCGLAALRSEELAQRVQFATTVEGIAALYNSSIRSCMTGEGEKFAPFYVANGYQVAYFTQDGKVTARCVVKDRCFSECYGPEKRWLEGGLLGLGFQKEIKVLRGKQFDLPRNPDGKFYLPYLDDMNGTWFAVVEESDSLRVEHVGISYDEDEPLEPEIAQYIKDALERGFSRFVKCCVCAVPHPSGEIGRLTYQLLSVENRSAREFGMFLELEEYFLEN